MTEDASKTQVAATDMLNRMVHRAGVKNLYGTIGVEVEFVNGEARTFRYHEKGTEKMKR